MSVFEPEYHAPVAADLDCPLAPAIALERMQVRTWKIHVLDPGSGIQMIEDQPQTLGMNGLYAFRATGQKEPLQSLVPEAPDHAPL